MTNRSNPSRTEKKYPSSVRLNDETKQYVENLADIHKTSISKIIIAHLAARPIIERFV
jgi:hypothetical protein